MSSRIYFRIANDILHDLSLGLFPGTVVGAWLISRAAASVGEGGGAVTGAGSALWGVFVLGLIVSVTTGLLRLRYWKLNVRTGFLETKGTMAVVKHSTFVLILIGSAVVLWRLVG